VKYVSIGALGADFILSFVSVTAVRAFTPPAEDDFYPLSFPVLRKTAVSTSPLLPPSDHFLPRLDELVFPPPSYPALMVENFEPQKKKKKVF